MLLNLISSRSPLTPMLLISGLLSLLLLSCQSSSAQVEGATSLPDGLEATLDSLIARRMSEQHIPGAAVLILQDGKILLKKGYGYAHMEGDSSRFDPDRTIFRIGSISKTFTAMAVLKLAEQGHIDLHADVNQYLKSVQVPSTFDEPVTAAHLLTHSAGFDELPGRVVYEAEAQQSLSEFLTGRLVRTRPPGLVSSYSTYGIALAGLLVEEVSDLPLEEFMRRELWTPMGMDQTSITLPASQGGAWARGYEFHQGQHHAQPWEYYHTFPASSINSTLENMGHYIQMLLNGGQYNGRQVLASELTQAMQTQQLSVHPEVYGFAYGFYRRDRAGLEVWNHGGDMLGYSNWISLVPELNLGIMVMHHHEGTGLRSEIIQTILAHYGSEPDTPENPQRLQSDVAAFAGQYKWMTTCYTCPNSHEVQTRALVVNPDQTLSGFGRRFYQVAPLLFKSYDGQRIMGFVRDEAGEIRYMSLGGINAFEKVAD